MEIINCHWKFCSRVPFLAAPASSPRTRIFDLPKIEPCSANRPLHVCALSPISTFRKNFSGESTPKSHIWVEISIFVFGVWGGPKVKPSCLKFACRCFLTNLQISKLIWSINDRQISGNGGLTCCDQSLRHIFFSWLLGSIGTLSDVGKTVCWHAGVVWHWWSVTLDHDVS